MLKREKQNLCFALVFLAITLKNYINERQKKFQKTHFSEIMQLFC